MASKKRASKKTAVAKEEEKVRSGTTFTYEQRKARGTGMNMTTTIDEERRDKLDRIVASGKYASRSAFIAAAIDRAAEP